MATGKKRTFTITGRVINRDTAQGIADLQVEAWDKDLIVDDLVGSAVTDEKGYFRIKFGESHFRELFLDRDPDLYFKVLRDTSLLASTEDKVLWNVKKADIAVTIEVELPADDTGYSVQGQIRESDGNPLAGATVRASDKDLRTEELLGEAVTDDTGRYAIRYTPAQFARAEKDRADLIVRVVGADDTELVASEILFNAQPDETVDLIVGGGRYRGPSEYSAFIAELTPILQGLALADLKEDTEHQDITFLANESGIDRTRIEFLKTAAIHAVETRLPGEVFYGFFRQGLPVNLNELLDKDTSSLRTALEDALKNNVIPLSVKTSLQDILARLEQLKKAQALDHVPEPGVVPVRPILETVIASPAKQETLLDLYTSNEGPIDDFWRALREHPDFRDAGAVDAIQTSVRLGMLTHNHVPLVTHLKQALADRVWTRQGGQGSVTIEDVSDFAKLKESDWLEIIGTAAGGAAIGVPELTPGETAEDKAAYYATTLTAMMEAAFPTKFVASRLAEDGYDDSGDLGRFFRNSPAFDLQTTRVDGYLAEHPEVLSELADPKATVARLNKIQRTYRVASGYAGMRTLLDVGLDSARAISKLTLKDFTARYGNTLGGSDKATQAYQRAHVIASSAMTLFTKFSAAMNATPVAAIPAVVPPGGPTPTSVRTFLSATAGPAALAQGIPDWATLFGTQDLAWCACEHCRSVYSPAAYLVDILNLLKYCPAGERSAVDVLFDRRPDLADIELSCENTNTVLPYVDLVNELLEEEVSPETAVPARSRQSTKTQAELLAYPEHLNLGSNDGESYVKGAYDILAEAVYPWDLPFHLWWEEVRGYFRHLGVDRVVLMETFQQSGETLEPSALDIATERLGFTPFERSVVTTLDKDPARVASDWGVEDLDSEDFSQVSTLIRRSGLSVEKLKAVLSTDFLRQALEGGTYTIGPDPEDPDLAVTCDATQLFVQPSLSQSALDRFHRFVRLWRRLGWSTQDTDAAITILGDGSIKEALVLQLAAVKQLLALLKMPVGELLGCWDAVADREAKLATALGLSPTDLGSYLELTGIDPFSTAEAMLEFVNQVNRVKRSSFSTRQLDYIYRHVAAPGDPIAPLTEEIIRFLWELQDGLGRIDAETSAPAQPTREVIENRLSLIASPEEVAKVLSFVASVPVDTVDNRAFVQLHFPYVDSNKAYGVLLVAAPPATEQEEQAHISSAYAYILRHLLTHVRSVLSESLVKQVLSTAVGLDGATTGLLVGSLLESRLNPPQPAINDYLALRGNGLSATYYQSTDLTGPVSSGTEAEIDFAWGSGPPHLALQAPVFSARFEGRLFAPQREEYLFTVRTSGGVRLRIADQLIIDQWDNNVPAEFSASVVLAEPSDFYPCILEFTNAADDAFLRLGWSSSSTPQEIVPKRRLFAGGLTSLDRIIDSYLVLHKSALIIKKFKITSRELAYLSAHAGEFSGFDLNALPLDPADADPVLFEQWQRLLAIVTLRNHLPRGDRDIIDLFGAAAAPGATRAEVRDLIVIVTGWNRADVEAAAAGLGLAAADFSVEHSLLRLRDMIALRKRLGIELEKLFDWASVEPDQAQADEMRALIGAKYDAEQWLEKARELRDTLRERQRAALVSYLVARPDEQAGKSWHDANGLYDYFLVDAEMSPCQLISRIKLAINTTQLFIQRSLMNLEPEVSLRPEDENHWRQWMKSYRVWEANRKTFLYPENWIFPELRDDKSPFFEELERELQQNDITNDAAETALLHYLEKLDGVSRLQICGMYHQTESASDGKTDILHVVGRTFGSPAVYYYRQRIDAAYWTAWEKVDVDIEGEHLVPVVFNRRLYLLWPIFTEKPPKTPDIPDAGDRGSPPETTLEIKLAWTERRQKKWSGKRVARAVLTTAGLSLSQLREDYIFKARVDAGGRMVVGCYARSE